MQIFAILAYAAGAASALNVHSHRQHAHSSKRALSAGSWYHDEGHPVHKLFRRATITAPAAVPPKSSGSAGSSITTDKKKYPVVGSDEWKNSYPPDYGDFYSKKMPQAWTDALDAAIAAGKIPNIPVSVNSSITGEPTYGTGTDPAQADICSSSAQCRIDGDIWDAPPGVIGIGFDDGPLPTSDVLYAFLKANNQTATHYFIGVNILDNHKEFLTAFENGDDIAVHTWSHPLMTTKTNLEILAELGWTAQIIHDSTGGRVPKYWRPPYGDSDRRVHAIAKEVFGLTGIIWNQDTDDWSLTEGGTTPAKIASQFDGWLKGPKTPGLIILEHELSDESVAAFISAYPQFTLNGWNPISQARMYTTTPYQNAGPGTNGSIHAANVYVGFKKLKTPLASLPPPTASGLIVEPTSTSMSTLASASSTTTVSSSTTSDSSTVISTTLIINPSAVPVNASNTSSGNTLALPSGLIFFNCFLFGVLLMKYAL